MSNKVKIGSGIVEAETANAEDLAKLDGAATAVAVRPTTAMGVYDFGDDPSPLSLARIRIAHNISPREPEGTPKGSLVLGKDWDCLLCKGGEAVKVIILGFSKYWKERPDTYDPSQILRTFRTRKDAVEAGMRLDWGPYGSGVRPNCCPCLDIQMLVQRPEGVNSPLFCCVLGGREYAPAIATFDKKAFAGADSLLKIVALRDTQVRHVPLNQADLTNFYFDLKTVTFETKQRTKVPYFTLALSLDQDRKYIVPDEATRKDLADLKASSSGAAVADGMDDPML